VFFTMFIAFLPNSSTDISCLKVAPTSIVGFILRASLREISVSGSVTFFVTFFSKKSFIFPEASDISQPRF